MKTKAIITVLFAFIAFGFMRAQPQHAWSFGFGSNAGPSNAELGNDIGTDAMGNVYVCGRLLGTADLDPGPFTATIAGGGFIAKYDPSGNYLWSASLGSEARSLDIDGSGNVYVLGNFSGSFDFDPGSASVIKTSEGANDIYVTKFSPSGTLVWAITMGGSETDAGLDLCLDNSSNVFVTGNFRGTADFDPSAGVYTLTQALTQANAFFAKYRSTGTFVSAKMLESNSVFSLGSIISGQGVGTDSGGNIYLLGAFSGTTDMDPGSGSATLTSHNGTSRDVFVARYDSTLSYVWSFAIGNAATEDAWGIDVDSEDNLYVGGIFGSTSSNQVDLDPSGSFSLITSNGGQDGFLAKYSPAKVLLWGWAVGGTGIDQLRGMSVAGNQVGIAGTFNSVVDFDPGAGSHTIIPTALNDLYFATYSASNGTFLNADNMGGTDNDWSESIYLDGSNIHLTGYFRGTADFDPGSNTASSVSNGASDVYVVKLGPACIITASASTSIVCAGSPVTLSTNATSSIVWSTGSNSVSIVVSPTTNTTYTVTGAGTGTSGGSCSNSVAVTVFVNPLPTKPTISAYYSDGTLFNNGTGGGGNITTTFYKGLTSQNHVNLKIGNLLDTNYSSVELRVSSILLEVDDHVAFLSPTNTSLTIQVNPPYKGEAENIYYVLISNNDGCQISSALGFFMEDIRCGNDSTKVIICHNGNGICVSRSALSTHQGHGDSVGVCATGSRKAGSNTTGIINMDTNAGLTVFPNPVRNILAIQSTSSFTGKLALSDISGRRVMIGELQNGTCEIDMGTLPPGFYLLSLEGSTGTIKVIKD